VGRPRILLLDADRRATHYATLREAMEAEWFDQAVRAEQLDLVLVTSEWPPHVGTAVASYVREGVPVLHLADGIVEWRQIWENPGMWSSLPIYQPVLAHKIACLGRAQARVLESWGNLGKCEVTGSPRLDPLLGREPRRRATGEPFRFLVGTAQSPGFTEEQRRCLLAGLVDLKGWFEKQDPRAVAPVWRLQGGMDEALGVRNDATAPGLADALARVDALVTTPSTLALEGMLQGVPVALLDYTNSPQYVRAAWSFSCAAHVEAGLAGMLEEDPQRMLFQAFVLHDELECHSPAAPRVARLAQEMIERGRRCRRDRAPLELPPRLLPDPQLGHHLPERAYDLAKLYPQRALPGGGVAELHAEVLQLRRLLEIERERYWGVGLRARLGRLWWRLRGG
jgi:hypothetical protein